MITFIIMAMLRKFDKITFFGKTSHHDPVVTLNKYLQGVVFKTNNIIIFNKRIIHGTRECHEKCSYPWFDTATISNHLFIPATKNSIPLSETSKFFQKSASNTRRHRANIRFRESQRAFIRISTLGNGGNHLNFRWYLHK
jgi:hypothetical protein